MNATYFYIILSTVIVSLISFVGAAVFVFKEEKLKKLTNLLVGLSAGTLLGESFLHLIPETAENSANSPFVWLLILAGIIIFFILEKIVHWRHCHIPTSEEHCHPVGTMNLIGDALHNFIDGVIIAVSFLASAPLGIATTIAVISHEIPQEIGDFGVLIYAGYTRKKALYLNFFSGLIAVLGAALGIIIGSQMENFINIAIPLAAGGFIYIASSDLIPELHKEKKVSNSVKQLFLILAGITMMAVLKIYLK